MFEFWSHLVDWFSSHAVIPLLTALHLNGLAGNPDEISEAVLISVLQVAIIGFLFRPLESIIPAEKWTDRKLTRVDYQYTLLMLLGIFPMFTYLVLTPFNNYFGGGGDSTGDDSLLSITRWIPALNGHPLALFLVYYVIYDLVYYWMHRLQHALPWWWALHSMHHSQRQMSCWTNDRGSLVDGFLQSMVLAVVGLLIGVAPAEFAWLMLLGELVQNFSHANVRIRFGPVFDRVFVAPTFHRLHHMLVDPERPNLHNCNFGQVFSVWDVLFGTALYGEPVRPTGVGDPMVDVDNNYGLIGLHWSALRRFWGAVTSRAGWRLGEVGFGPDYRPIPVDQLDLHALAHHITQPRQPVADTAPVAEPVEDAVLAEATPERS
ncbi:sterol desaturase/sphingolipid hydroxylase (fatty acid hydroxylase superfamily) [Luteibacter sp. Sphag1AF]|uniref:sterol desaturase family protein n=1 Tax=Luteibacter sp. Sphag1AF TaxID=2587031 RepID=UPI0016134F5D|nr:sterol desaturase family protein [Luteibacter sp. Sphag1AF]MBB3228551.1 sterol desaturase/sphingolipid hydroxylase (fatty acid hydroxylase superfamily) [Luteibacter sp. Sphag1AF]